MKRLWFVLGVALATGVPALAQTPLPSQRPDGQNAHNSAPAPGKPQQASPLDDRVRLDLEALIGTSKPQSLPVVMGARLGEHADRTRFVIELSDPVKFRMFTLANPNRVVLDLPDVLWRIQGGPQKPSGTGAVKAYRYGQFRPGNARFVIDLNMPVNVAEPLVLPPQDGYGYRVVIDLFPSTQAAYEKKSGWPADLRPKAPVVSAIPSAPKSEGAKRVIVIDAGHGGLDSGTVGVDGTQEKDVVLAVAKRLGKELQRRGYITYLTRDTDVFIPLYSRTPLAHAKRADLFVSLHADSNPNPSVSGASIYTLSEKGSDREAAALAQKENQSDIIAGVDLTGDNSSVASILIDLAQRDTMNKSSRFAEVVLSKLKNATDILPREPHRSAAFVVLKSPDVPAVLIELGYLSNARDCARMGTDAWRSGVASSIADAVDGHFEPVTAAAGPSQSASP